MYLTCSSYFILWDHMTFVLLHPHVCKVCPYCSYVWEVHSFLCPNNVCVFVSVYSVYVRIVVSNCSSMEGRAGVWHHCCHCIQWPGEISAFVFSNWSFFSLPNLSGYLIYRYFLSFCELFSFSWYYCLKEKKKKECNVSDVQIIRFPFIVCFYVTYTDL